MTSVLINEVDGEGYQRSCLAPLEFALVFDHPHELAQGERVGVYSEDPGELGDERIDSAISKPTNGSNKNGSWALQCEFLFQLMLLFV